MALSLVEGVEAELLRAQRTYTEVSRFLPSPRPAELSGISVLRDVLDLLKS